MSDRDLESGQSCEEIEKRKPNRHRKTSVLGGILDIIRKKMSGSTISEDDKYPEFVQRMLPLTVGSDEVDFQHSDAIFREPAKAPS
ncbi:Hypothetical protein NTJ_14476 [Nesidiocoris tenuis]|uniref:BESS domain-containing protein n=1 Tax=Nesidiocoris tenuis TaxID=355587 RepID=A0ABN7BCT8_9HEMI|nr:Hypothetical protein NTJ_14476 [Nesidiocoris tenuis]